MIPEYIYDHMKGTKFIPFVLLGNWSNLAFAVKIMIWDWRTIGWAVMDGRLWIKGMEQTVYSLHYNLLYCIAWGFLNFSASGSQAEGSKCQNNCCEMNRWWDQFSWAAGTVIYTYSENDTDERMNMTSLSLIVMFFFCILICMVTVSAMYMNLHSVYFSVDLWQSLVNWFLHCKKLISKLKKSKIYLIVVVFGVYFYYYCYCTNAALLLQYIELHWKILIIQSHLQSSQHTLGHE